MASRTWLTFLVGTLALAGAAILGASCGSSTTSGDGCVRAGAKCPLGCQPNLGCVSCGGNADCGPGSPICVLGQCEQCGTNAECGTGQACFPGDHTCRTKCATNADCSGEAPI